MTIFNFGSVFIARSFQVQGLPDLNERVSAARMHETLCGSGARQSLAVAKAGSKVMHLGTVGGSAKWLIEELEQGDVDTTNLVHDPGAPEGSISQMEDETGARLSVAFAGANGASPPQRIISALRAASAQDTLLIQNQTNAQVAVAAAAHELGMKVFYTANPFDLGTVRALFPFITTLLIESRDLAKLTKALGMATVSLPISELVVYNTFKGSVEWHDLVNGANLPIAPPQLPYPIKRNAAIDTFAGFFVAGMESGRPVQASLMIATAAAALHSSREAAIAQMPDLVEVTTFLHSKT